MTTQTNRPSIVITRTARGTRVEANGPAAWALLVALSEGAPTTEAAAVAALKAGLQRPTNMKEAA
ncbi:hypothetical protein ACKZDW_13250 [Ralstonia syzygii subsp. celebesensis]|uniref:hypothetical protein n=1 Tax=Ralstonia syzygii TaxID=28097 RepID=UPI00387E0564